MRSCTGRVGGDDVVMTVVTARLTHTRRVLTGVVKLHKAGTSSRTSLEMRQRSCGRVTTLVGRQDSEPQTLSVWLPHLCPQRSKRRGSKMSVLCGYTNDPSYLQNQFIRTKTLESQHQLSRFQVKNLFSLSMSSSTLLETRAYTGPLWSFPQETKRMGWNFRTSH